MDLQESSSKSAGAKQAWPGHPLASWVAAKVFKHPARGNSRGFPAVSPLCLNLTHNIQGRKIQLMYLKQPEDGEAIPLLVGFVSH